jgi:hypothetical protein
VTTICATHGKCCFELRIHVDSLLHRKIVQLMCEHDTSTSTECACGRVGHEQVVGRVNGSGGDVRLTKAPVVRVILPNNRLQTKRIGDCTNAVLHQEKKCRYPDISKRDGGNKDSYINVSIGRAPAGRSDAHDELDSFHLGESISGQVTSPLCGDRPGAYRVPQFSKSVLARECSHFKRDISHQP